MWSSNDYGLDNIGGSRPLGDFTEDQRNLALAYKLAKMLAAGKPMPEVMAHVDLPNREIEIGEGSDDAAMAYGLKPYIVAPQYDSQSLVPLPMQNPQNKKNTISTAMHPNMLHSILHQIVEDA